MRRRLPLLALSACLLAQAAAARDPRPRERGFPLLRNYPPSEYEGGSQNFDLAQDPAGLVYVANLQGVLIHDGAWWRKVPLANGLAAFCIETDAQGRIAVGGVGELGMLEADAAGALRYRSLLPELPAGERDVGDVWRIHATGQGFVFLTDVALLRWDGLRMTRLASFPDPDAPVSSHGVAGAVLVWLPDHGLHRIEGDQLVLMPGGAAFRGRRLDAILPAGGNELLLAIRDEGLRIWNGTTERAVSPGVDRRLASTPASVAKLLPDGRAVLGTRGGGVLVLDAEWELEMAINAGSGLPDASVHALLVDRGHSLWVALDNGLTVVEIELPLSVFDERTGLEGAVLDIARHGGRLWVGTTGGLFVLERSGDSLGMRRIDDLPRDVTTPLDVGDELLVATGLGIFHGTPGAFTLVPGTEEMIVYGMARSSRDAARVWLGLRTGVTSLVRRSSGWLLEPPIADAPRYVTSFVEREDGTLWCGSVLAGVVRIDADARRTVTSGEGELSVHAVGGRILVPDGSQVLLLDEELGEPRRDPSLEGLERSGTVFQLAEAPDGNLWLNTLPPKVAMPRADGAFGAPLSLPALPADDMQEIAVEPDGVVWMMTNRGLFRFAGGVGDLQMPAATPLIRRVGRVGSEDLFGGAPDAEPAVSELPYRHGRLRFEYAPVTYRAGVEYQYRLDPSEGEWSVWSGEAFTEFTNLAEGAYVFEVRSRHPGGEVSPAASWVFRVAPPWYRSAPAWLAWLAGALALMLGYAQVRTARLRRRTSRLERLVSARTRELEAANEQLHAQSRRDDLTGLWNRRHLDAALLEECQRARRSGQPLSFVLMDLDGFKAVNDELGHAAGDRCLRRLGAFLAESVSRSGEVVARYGGEEFGLLLPGSDLETAERLAERLREALEQLDLGSVVGFDRPITASFGVASFGAGLEDPKALIGAADDALYRGKSAGRNRVRRGVAES
jgi:diguanylate cyclase (GGDEF)-like protein